MATQLQGRNTPYWPEAQVDFVKRDIEDKDTVAEVEVETPWLEARLGKSATKLWCYLLASKETEFNLTLECYQRLSSKTGLPDRTVSRAMQKLKSVDLVRNMDWDLASQYSLLQRDDMFRVLIRVVAGRYASDKCSVSHHCYKLIKALPERGGKREGAGRKLTENPKRKRKDTRDRSVPAFQPEVTFIPRSFMDTAHRQEADQRQAKWYDREEWLRLVRGGNQSGRPKSIESIETLFLSPSENCETSPAKQASVAAFNVPSATSMEWEGWDEKEEKESVDDSPASLVALTNQAPEVQEVSVHPAIDTTGVNTTDPSHPFYVHPNALAFFQDAFKLLSTTESPEARARRAQREAREQDQALLAQLPTDPRDIIPLVCVPYPKGLRQEMSDKDIAARLAEVYSSVLWKRFNMRCWINPNKIENSKYFKKLAVVGRKMLEYGVNPVTWALWSFNIAPDYTRTQVPRLMWVFSVKRIKDHHGWFLRDEPVRGKRFPMQPETATELHYTYKKFKEAVFAGMSIQAAMDKHFPNGEYDRWVTYAKRVVAKEQRQIDESIEDGVCVW